jgi:hypothetical protein
MGAAAEHGLTVSHVLHCRAEITMTDLPIISRAEANSIYRPDPASALLEAEKVST